MTGLPATGLSVDLVVSASSPMSPLSPGAGPFQSSITLAGSEARLRPGVSAKAKVSSKAANRDGCIQQAKPIHPFQSRDFHAVNSFENVDTITSGGKLAPYESPGYLSVSIRSHASAE